MNDDMEKDVEAEGRDVDVWFARVLLWWLPDWKRGQTWSLTVALMAVDKTSRCMLCRLFGKLCCWWLSVAVQPNHCGLCRDPDAPPSPPSVYERAGVCFILLGLILLALAVGVVLGLVELFLQDTLFDWQPTPEAERQFAAVLADNPRLWMVFERFTFEAIHAGMTHFSADAVLHRMRWHSSVEARDGSGYRLNNNLTPFLSREWARRHPDHADFFRTRKSKADRSPP